MVNQSKPTVALFGGSFDPPHKGHQEIVRLATKHLSIRHLLVVPAYLNPFKSFSLASATQRLAWCHTLFDSLDKVLVTDFEIREGRSTTTSHTVKHFNRVYNVQYLIIGSDNLDTLTKWHEFAWLNAHITWVIVTRHGYPLDVDNLKSYEVLILEEKASSSQIRDTNDLHYVDNQIKKSVQNVLEGKH